MHSCWKRTLPDRLLKLQLSIGTRWLMWELGVVNCSCSSHWYCTNFYNSFLTVVALFFCVMAGLSLISTFCESSRYGDMLFRNNFHLINCQKHFRGDFQNMFAFVLREKVLMDFFYVIEDSFRGALYNLYHHFSRFSPLNEHSSVKINLFSRLYPLMNKYSVRQFTSLYY